MNLMEYFEHVNGLSLFIFCYYLLLLFERLSLDMVVIELHLPSSLLSNCKCHDKVNYKGKTTQLI